MNCARAKKIDITSDVPWNPEDVQKNIYIITPEPYNDILDDTYNERKLYYRKTLDARNLDWWIYHPYFMYPGEIMMKKLPPTHNKDGKDIVNNPIPNPPQINKSIAPNKYM